MGGFLFCILCGPEIPRKDYCSQAPQGVNLASVEQIIKNQKGDFQL